MPQSLVKNYLHITFSTKNRYPFIKNSIKEELFSYLGGLCKNMGCVPIQVGGHSDHVHILCLLSQKTALMDLIEETKSHSSKWIKTKGKEYESFYWQRGYGAFSVSQSGVENVKNYILSQEEHHKKRTFEDEYRAFLKEYDVEFDERFVWD